MRIAYFTENGFEGYVTLEHPSLKGAMAWIAALGAYHYNIHNIPSSVEEKFDLGIFNIPKTNTAKLKHRDLPAEVRNLCSRVAYIQEGPFWYWQDYPLDEQVWYYNSLAASDILYVHNEIDKNYYQGLIGHSDVRVFKTLMIPPTGIDTSVDRSGVMIGGNFVSWYGGFDSFITAREYSQDICAPSMGRRQAGEEQLGIKHLPYMQWDQFMQELNKVKLGVHLMRTYAAGTFALNCSYLGIPCIGYKGLDTQETLHPLLSVEDGDVLTAKILARKLQTELDFYQECSILTKRLYEEHYSKEIWHQEVSSLVK
jgi:hypothetical protein